MGGLYSYYQTGQTNNGYALNNTAASLYTPGSPFFTPALAALVPGGIAQELATQQKNPYNESLPYTPLHISQEYRLISAPRNACGRGSFWSPPWRAGHCRLSGHRWISLLD